jgi:hypothetical protein
MPIVEPKRKALDSILPLRKHAGGNREIPAANKPLHRVGQILQKAFLLL